jgi:hypothetical protein
MLFGGRPPKNPSLSEVLLQNDAFTRSARAHFEAGELLPESYFAAVNSDGLNELAPEAPA